MTIKELLNKAKYIQFPLYGKTYKKYNIINNIYKLPTCDLTYMYTELPNNSHHYTTMYHYKYDYATELYEKWLKNPTFIITSFKLNKYVINNRGYLFSHGRATIFPPSSLLRLLPYIEDQEILDRKNDDSLYGIYAKKEKIDMLYLNHTYDEVLDYSTNDYSLTYELMKDKEKAQNKFLDDKKLFISKLL